MKALLSLIVLLCLGVFGATAFAQEGSTCIPADVASQQVNDLFGSAVAATRTDDLSRYTVAYLIDEDSASSTGLLSAESVTNAANSINVVTSWDDFVTLNDETPVDAVFIHESIASSVDQEWLQTAYQNGLPVITLNMTFGERAELIGDNCSFAEFPSDGPLNNRPARVSGGDYYIYSYWLLQSGNAATAVQAELNTCSTDGVGGYDTSMGAGIGVVANADDLNDLLELGLLANKVEIRRALDNLKSQADQIMNASCRPTLNTVED
jgi:hypothetical protein